MNQKALYGGVITLALLAGAALSYYHHRAPAPTVTPPTTPATSLWDTPLNLLDGKTGTLAAYRGKPLIVNYWASWCGPCREEMPDFVAAQTSLQGKLQFVGVAIDNAADVGKFLQTTPVNYPILLGEQNAMEMMRGEGNSLGVLPFTAIYDATGKRVITHPGKLSHAKLGEYLKTFNLTL